MGCLEIDDFVGQEEEQASRALPCDTLRHTFGVRKEGSERKRKKERKRRERERAHVEETTKNVQRPFTQKKPQHSVPAIIPPYINPTTITLVWN